MPEKLTVVGLDGIVWFGPSLTRALFDSIRRRDCFGSQVRSRVRRQYKRPDKEGMHEVIAGSIKNKKPELIELAVHEATNRVLGRLDGRVSGYLSHLTSEGHKLVAMSSAPEFAVRAIISKLTAHPGLDFSDRHVLASNYPTGTDGRFTGEYSLLSKMKAISGLMNEINSPEIAVGVINGISDITWATAYCGSLSVANAGPTLKDRLGTDRDLAAMVSVII